MTKRSVSDERIAEIQNGIRLLKAERRICQPITKNITPATATYESIDEMVELIRAKLEHCDSTQLWAVDGEFENGDGATICITGNNKKGRDHANWISMLLSNDSFIFQSFSDLLTAIEERDAEIERLVPRCPECELPKPMIWYDEDRDVMKLWCLACGFTDESPA